MPKRSPLQNRQNQTTKVARRSTLIKFAPNLQRFRQDLSGVRSSKSSRVRILWKTQKLCRKSSVGLQKKSQLRPPLMKSRFKMMVPCLILTLRNRQRVVKVQKKRKKLKFRKKKLKRQLSKNQRTKNQLKYSN